MRTHVGGHTRPSVHINVYLCVASYQRLKYLSDFREIQRRNYLRKVVN